MNGTIQYTIRPYDTIWMLAQIFNTTVDSIMDLNPGVDPRKLFIGQVITIRPGLQYYPSTEGGPTEPEGMVTPPGRMRTTPGRAETAPGRAGTTPSGVGTTPSRAGTMPSGTGTTPGGMTMPSGTGTAPGGMTMPSGTGTAPGGMTMPNGTKTVPSGMGTMPSGTGTAPSGMTMPSGTRTAPGGMGTMPSGMGTAPSGMGTMPSGTGTALGGMGTTPSRTGTMPNGTGFNEMEEMDDTGFMDFMNHMDYMGDMNNMGNGNMSDMDHMDHRGNMSDMNNMDGVDEDFENLRNYFRVLWEQHVNWTRAAIMGIVHDLPEADLIQQRLLRNPEDFGNALMPFYGEDAAKDFEQLLTDHLTIAAELVKAVKAGDQAAADDANKRWHDNADQIAAFLASINPYWNEDDWSAMMDEHLNLLAENATQMIKGDYEASINGFDEIEMQALEMADMMAEGIMMQFMEMQ